MFRGKVHTLGLRHGSTSASTAHTIYALSTHLTRAAIGVIRISGPSSSHILHSLTKSQPLPKPRFASVRRLYRPQTSQLLDEALAIYFKEPKTYTGEDLVELHVHGGTAVIQAVLSSIGTLHSAEAPVRYAEAGEFSQRAFANGRFDLTEIEGIRELIDADTETARVAAVDSATGKNRVLFGDWREKLVKDVALLTAIIDFAEDTEIEDIQKIYDTVSHDIDALEYEIMEYLQRGERSEILLKGIKVTLLGPPNAGKSSILNQLASTEAAIVSDIAGTTRDVINVPLNIKGYKVVVGDTAGIRDLTKADKIEAEGIKRAKAFAQSSDLVLIVLGSDNLSIDDDFKENVKALQGDKRIIAVLNKCDLIHGTIEETVAKLSEELNIPTDQFIPVSCLETTGIEELSNHLVNTFKIISLTESTDPIIVTTRVKDILKNDVLYGFHEFNSFKELDDVVLATQGLQHSIDGIGKITGESVGVEEVLGVVFSSFCVGK
jgi:tRNA modification GTPase